MGTNKRFDIGPFRLELFRLAKRVVFRQRLNLGVDQWLLVFVEFNAGEAAFVVDWHGCPIFHGTGDVVDVDIVTEDSGRVDVAPFDRRSREPDE